jgi:hypothetical protein
LSGTETLAATPGDATMKKLGLILVSSLLLASATVWAQRTADIEGGVDHPAISRVKGSVIEFYEVTTFGTYKLPLDEKGELTFRMPRELEGKVTRIQYSTSTENNPEFILHNYKAAFKAAGFTILTARANEELALKVIAQHIKDHTGKKFFIVGHTDNVGTFTGNMTLSQDRAQAVLTELTTKYGIDAKQLEAHGAASLAPVTSNETDEGKALNRRVEVVVQ